MCAYDVCVCICAKEKEREKERKREQEGRRVSICLCGCVCVRLLESKILCACVNLCVCVCLCTCSRKHTANFRKSNGKFPNTSNIHRILYIPEADTITNKSPNTRRIHAISKHPKYIHVIQNCQTRKTYSEFSTPQRQTPLQTNFQKQETIT